MVVKILSALLGLIAGFWSYPYLNGWLIAPLAFIGAICVGIIVYFLCVRVFAEIIGDRL